MTWRFQHPICPPNSFIYIFLFLIPCLEDHVLRAFYVRYYSESRRWKRVTDVNMGHLTPNPRILPITCLIFPKRNPRFYKEGSGSFPKINLVWCLEAKLLVFTYRINKLAGPRIGINSLRIRETQESDIVQHTLFGKWSLLFTC